MLGNDLTLFNHEKCKKVKIDPAPEDMAFFGRFLITGSVDRISLFIS